MQEVVLYGVGLDGEKFYCKYKNKFKFVELYVLLAPLIF